MTAFASLATVLAVVLVAAVAGQFSGGRTLLGTVVPYAAFAIFLAGFCYRVLRWAFVPVPFRIPTTCGQQKSLPWIKSSRLDNPSTAAGAVGRMGLEILLFRSLFRNNRNQVYEKRLVFGEDKFLWLAALAFHWSLLVILLRHLRLLVEPVPAWVGALQKIDGFFQIGAPDVYLSDAGLIAALAYLVWRRLRDPLLRYVSLFSDYFALFLILAIGVTGVLMRHFVRVDVIAVKQFALSVVTFRPMVPPAIGALFIVHWLLVGTLAAYFPFSKLMHMGGIFLSPTRNLANNSRRQRHINPWNYPVKTHTYAEWEEEFRDKLKGAGIPLEADNARSASAD